MSILLAAMGLVVAIYYEWPAGRSVLSAYANWQRAGGILRTGFAAGFAGGILSELLLVYARDGGRWNATHGRNMLFRFGVFFINGMMVFEFYEWQAACWGSEISWRVVLPKVLVDQFGYTVLIATPYQTILFRWRVLRYSIAALWRELDGRFVRERMLPVLVTNWMFWIPGVTLVYSMPLILQMPLNIFATAMWSLLLAGVARPQDVPLGGAEPTSMLTAGSAAPAPAE